MHRIMHRQCTYYACMQLHVFIQSASIRKISGFDIKRIVVDNFVNKER